jgi:DNA repair protein RecO (recombination protein O)
LYGGYYIAELLSGLTEEFDPAPEVFDLAAASLNALSTANTHPSSVIIHFEISLLQRIGLLPNLFECSVCGGPVDYSGGYAHWVSQGGVLCQACRREEYAGKSISAGSIEILRRMAEASPELISRMKLSQQQAEECHNLAVSAITHALGRRPSTLRYIQI